MRRGLLALVLLVTVASVGAAQPIATKGDRLAWDQDAGSLTEAQSAIYKLTLDGAVPVVLAGVVCTGATSPFLCEAPFPAMTPGAHTVTLTAGNAAGDSVPSAPFAFQMIVVPLPPRNLRKG